MSAAVGAPETPARWTLRLPRGRHLELSARPRLMGVVNVTPDSFSDGGLWLDPEAAVEHALRLAAEGAEVLDLGAESTRPGGGVYGEGAEPVPAAEELRRLLPVLERLRPATEAVISVDTQKGEVAREVLAAGADLVNDVGGLADSELVEVVAEAGCPVVVMHSRGERREMQRGIRFDDVVEEVRAELADLGAWALAAGIAREQLVFDPGLGFGKTAEQNLELLRHLDRLEIMDRPLLVGASRKSFIAAATASAPPPDRRLGGSLAAAAWAVHHGAAFLRVHDVAETAQFLDVWHAIDLR